MSRKPPDPEPAANHERWIVTYADMVTLLFALFVVLWAMSDVNETKFDKVRTSLDQAFSTGVLKGTSGDSPIFDSETSFGPNINVERAQALAVIMDRFDSLRSDSGIGPPSIQIRTVDEDTITISLANNLLFDPGSASFEPGSQDVLKQVAASLLTLPESAQIRIVGHTDSIAPTGTGYLDNRELSAARALNVSRFLEGSGGVDPTRIEIVGKGEYAPVASNETPEGRALNRRVDIEILFEDPVSEEELNAFDIAGEGAAAPESQSSDGSEAE
jgi:chemotaxis protein MotB